MRHSNDNIKKIALTADIVNTLSGGVSEPQVVLKKSNRAHELRIKIAGVDSQQIKVEIHNNWLTVFHVINFQSGQDVVNVPRIVYGKSIPYFIDVENIGAEYSDDYLLVHMPYNARANGFHKKINIKQ